MHVSLCQAYTQLRRYDDAIESYRTAIGIDPQLSHAWLNLAGGAMELHRYDEVVPAAKRASILFPTTGRRT